MSIARVETMVKLLVTVLDIEELEMFSVLPSSSVVDILNTVYDPSRVLIQLILGKGKPSNEQVSDSDCGLRIRLVIIGSISIIGASKKKINKQKKRQSSP